MKQVLALDSTDEGLELGLEAAGYTLNRQYTTPQDNLLPHLAQVEGILLRSRITLTAELLLQAPNLKWIGRLGSGVENIDTQATVRSGIMVYSAPEGNRSAVGEHCLGMLLSLAHRIHWANAEVRQGAWNRASNMGWELEGSTIGIIGFGNMGSAFAQRLQGFHVRVITYDAYKTHYAPQGVSEVSLDTLLKESDVISLHVPLTSETDGMVNAAFLAACRRKPILLNTSRGNVVRSEAIWNSIQKGEIRGAALDVLDIEKASLEGLQEKPSWFEAFLHDPNVLITPHIAGWSTQSFPKMGEVLLRKILHKVV
ncbi:MAG: hypothetical protein ABR98_02475 [Cryomorphaceae bacterium BACL7 MAG-120910-bin2]|nr:MAG: hypothetical protein ABR98_02475 [Cryomorphaceae bacterium BACL7 MAG-120910-bin2]KRO69629.1 MAG: hypothetical protein ABR88_06490 [Cryomorphaceae bacterium BACL7 MAG-120322-bin74]KRO82621.1 MAG: hypothetical protein ABR87_07075 [Cryomorphaceae bacterium BACL7 MAG-121220-bin83]